MKLSLVMCTRNRASQLAEALQSLLKLRGSCSWEVVIVDNGSTDDTQAVVSRFQAQFPGQCTLVGEPRRGLGNARNRGWKTAQGEIIAFTDDDCYPAEDFLTAIVQCFEENPRLGFLGGRILLHDPTDYPITIQDLNIRLDFLPGEFIDAGIIQGANMACRRAALEDIGGYDARFGAGALFACEDIDVAVRISAQGWHGAYDPRPLVYHHHRRKTQAEADRLMGQYDRGRGAYYVKCLLNPRLRLTYSKMCCLTIWRQSPRRTARELIAGGEYLARVAVDYVFSARKRV